MNIHWKGVLTTVIVVSVMLIAYHYFMPASIKSQMGIS